MLFNSYVFMLLFIPVTLMLWWILGKYPQLRLLMLVIASYLFYGWNHWEFVFLLLVSTVVDFAVGQRLDEEYCDWKRRCWLAISLISNLGMLGYFKYCGFFAESINAVSQFLRTGDAVQLPDVILPIGISFYTFQTLSYSIDLYRRQVKPARSLLHFAAYVSMFPQLIAGPIVRYKDIEEQINALPQRIDWSLASQGIWFFVIGMSQKIILADTAATIANPLLDNPEPMQFFAAWLALLAYSVQLYFDFAGYSNMAIGLGLMLGFTFPTNFDSPYQANNIQEFWRRWHITLGTFLRDYLYIPLGGNRYGRWLSMRNLLIVMLLGGLWHGAGWTFVLWGAYHGLMLIGHSVYRTHFKFTIPRPLAIAVTFLFVIYGWLWFRATSFQMATDWTLSLIGRHGVELRLLHEVVSIGDLVALISALSICWFLPNASQMRRPLTIGGAVITAGLLCFCILRFDVESPFLYFQF